MKDTYSPYNEQINLRKVTRLGAYGIAINQRNILLITKRPNGCYSGLLDLPGGGIDFGETAEEALRREFAEEVGMSFESLELVDNYSCLITALNVPDPFHFHHIGQIYRVYGVRDIFGAKCEEEHRWYNIDSLELSSLTPFAQEVVKLLKRK